MEHITHLKNIGKSKVLLVKISLNLGNQSSIGLLVTNRDYDVGGHGRVIGIDGIFNVNTDYIIEFDLSKFGLKNPSQTFLILHKYLKIILMPLMVNHSQICKTTQNRRVTNGSQTGFRYKEIDPEFRADLGLITRTGFKDLNYWQSLTLEMKQDLEKSIFEQAIKIGTIPLTKKLGIGLETLFLKQI